MQKVTTCVYSHNGEVLLLNKPRRDWWVAPGGKVIEGESIAEGCVREFYEETGLKSELLQLVSIFTVVNKKDDQIVNEWMFYTFKTNSASGKQLLDNHEGYLEWHPVDKIPQLPMAEGDRLILDHALNGQGIMIGTFVYSEDFELLETRYSIHP
ncbi:MAG: 8-oxo-dGTP diphosphatase [Bacillales bacterium]|jgi:8-oxo-dGTP diphosphatase|nr:8-oxo-dGTP diphosphatase [Bacillales bacterium]